MDKSLQVYGIPNCDTVKKALTWLRSNEVAFTFHDYKKTPPTEKQLKEWCKQAGWENLLNRKGTTYRQLDDAVKESLTGAAPAIRLMMEKPSVIRRPLIEQNGKVITLGFDENEYRSLFS